MEWLTANWFSVVIFIAFVAIHLFGHGGHGGHSGHGGGDRHGSKDERNSEEARRSVNESSGGHQH